MNLLLKNTYYIFYLSTSSTFSCIVKSIEFAAFMHNLKHFFSCCISGWNQFHLIFQIFKSMIHCMHIYSSTQTHIQEQEGMPHMALKNGSTYTHSVAQIGINLFKRAASTHNMSLIIFQQFSFYCSVLFGWMLLLSLASCCFQSLGILCKMIFRF